MTVGETIGPYQVLAKLGEGGMGEVYRATDTNLKRLVALKILPEAFATDAERLARFQREAEVLAALSHPNIAAIHGLERRADTTALVMELVEGEDLAERIARGALAVDEALPIAMQIASALEAAHEQGIVHRDLKPANIKVRDDGTVKVLDFGLAKAVAGSAASAGPANSPTMTSPAMTAHGVILGTAAYMSPEQAKGRPADRRADIWAFGVVLYEMLGGRRLFDGESMAEVLGAVLRAPLDLAALPADTPRSIRRLLRRCLERDRNERLGDMGSARLEIRDALAGDAEPLAVARGVSSRSRDDRWKWVSAGLGVLLVAGMAVMAAWWPRGPARAASTNEPAALARFALLDDPNLRLNVGGTQPFAVARDGRAFVFSAGSDEGTSLWIRTLDEPEPRRLSDTLGGFQPAISPDGQWVAFVVANHVIRKLRLSGGSATTVASIDDTTAALAWASDDTIVFEKIGSTSGIHKVSANGGAPELLIPLDANEIQQRRPVVLRESQMVAYASSTSDGRTALAMFSLADGRRRRLDVEGIQALGMIDDHLTYARRDGSLLAVPIDLTDMRVTGSPRQLEERVFTSLTGTAVTLSESGTLIFRPGGSRGSRIMIGDASGRAGHAGDWVRPFGSARFSPDGTRIAVGIDDPEAADLWTLTRQSGEAMRVTREGGATLMDWTPDGKALMYVRDAALWVASNDGSSDPRRLVEIEGRVISASMLPDGRGVVIVRRLDGQDGSLDRTDIVRASFDAGAAEPILMSKVSGSAIRPADPRVSPDGTMLAFVDTNERQVHVRALAGSDAIQVSESDGEQPVWSHDSRRLYYATSAGVMVAELQKNPLAVGRRAQLPAWPVAAALHDVSPDGQSFLLVAPIDPAPRALVVMNWGAHVRELLRR